MFDVIDETREILHEYHLCDYCLGRIFASRLRVVSHKILGEKIRGIIKQSHPKSCYICKTLMSHHDLILRKLVELSKGYEFSTFLIGAILQPSILDRDDIVRSKLKLRGISGIKSDLTKEMGRQFGKWTKTKVDYQNPDIVLTIDLRKDNYEVKSKALLLSGRYTKIIRGIPQKQSYCNRCEGKGCFACDFHGISEYESVEGKIAKFLFQNFGAQQAKFTWIGSEDVSSLVLGIGRPFFVKLTNPHKRIITIPQKIQLEGISLQNLKFIPKIPTSQIKFRIEVLVEVETEKDVNPDKLKVLQCLKGMTISINENSSWKNQKKIYCIKIERINSRSFQMLLESDGGIPLKNFVSGKNVEPNLSILIENPCKCTSFDFHKILLTN
jgi:tRNA pseudouridine synthase 10